MRGKFLQSQRSPDWPWLNVLWCICCFEMFVVTNLLVLDYLSELWLGVIAVRVLDLQSAGCRLDFRHHTFGCNSGRVVHTRGPLSPSSINWCWPMSSDAVQPRRQLQVWRQLAVHHRQRWYIHLWAHCWWLGMSTPLCSLRNMAVSLCCIGSEP